MWGFFFNSAFFFFLLNSGNAGIYTLEISEYFWLIPFLYSGNFLFPILLSQSSNKSLFNCIVVGPIKSGLFIATNINSSSSSIFPHPFILILFDFKSWIIVLCIAIIFVNIFDNAPVSVLVFLNSSSKSSPCRPSSCKNLLYSFCNSSGISSSGFIASLSAIFILAFCITVVIFFISILSISSSFPSITSCHKFKLLTISKPV